MIKNLLTQAKEGILVWRLALLDGFLYVYIAMATTFGVVFNNVKWSELDGTAKAVAIVGISAAGAIAAKAFISNTMKSVATKGLPYIEDTTAEQTTRTNIQQTTTIKTP